MGCLKIEQKEKIYERCIGLSNISRHHSNEVYTLFRIGSVSKTFTAVIVLRLMEEGKLSLSDKLATWCPDIENADKITIEHLLRHRSGIYNYTDTSEYEQYYKDPASSGEMLARIKRYGILFQPGERMQYSNSNYFLLAYIAEKATGKEYSRLLEEMILKPCGLKNTREGSVADTSSGWALSYRWMSGWVVEPSTDLSVSRGAGSLVSTPSDLVSFTKYLINSKLISHSSLQQMMTMQDGYGLGVMKYPFYDKVVYGHAGGIDAFRAFVGFLPSDSISIALCSNGMAFSMNEILIGVLSIWYRLPYTFPKFNSVAFETNTLKNFEGVYVSNQFPLEIKIWVENNQLMARATGQSAFPLEAVSPSEFQFAPADIHIVFKNNNLEFVLRQRGMELIFKRK